MIDEGSRTGNNSYKMIRNCKVAIRAPPHLDFCDGYVGVPLTAPRLLGSVEVRSLSSKPISVTKVSIALQRTDKVTVSSHLSSNRHQNDSIIGQELVLFAQSTAPDGVHRMDLPFKLSLPSGDPKDMPSASLLLPGLCETTYALVATVIQHHSNAEHLQPVRCLYPIKIERFDLLSTWGMFNTPRVLTFDGPDHLTTLQVALPSISAGTLDLLRVQVTVSANPDWVSRAKRVRLNKLSASIEETIQYMLPEGPSTKKSKLVKREIDLYDTKLLTPSSSTFVQAIDLTIPDKYPQVGVVDTTTPLLYPMIGGFTNSTFLYSIDYRLIVKVVLSGAKDLICNQEIKLSPWNRDECQDRLEQVLTYLQAIEQDDGGHSSARALVEMSLPRRQIIRHAAATEIAVL